MGNLNVIGAIMAMLAAIQSSSAQAEPHWVMVAESSTSGTTTYIDINSIRRGGDVVRAWQLNKYPNDKNGWKETRALMEENCASDQSRLLQLIVYFVDGTNSTNFDVSDWIYVTPDTMQAKNHEYACNYKGIDAGN